MADDEAWNQNVQDIVNRRRNFGAAIATPDSESWLRPMRGGIPPVMLKSIQPEPPPALISIAPTLYPPVAPIGTVIVQNFITINPRSREFVEFDQKLEEVLAALAALRGSNEISSEVRDQFIAEITAGRPIITAPKASRDLIDLLLANPLKSIAIMAGTAAVGHLAVQAIDLLEKLIAGVISGGP
jgi:hypothetical protein